MLVVALACSALVAGPDMRSEAAEGVTGVGSLRDGAGNLAGAMSVQPGLLLDAAWSQPPPSPNANGIARRPLGRFPRTAERFAVMTTGSIERIDDASYFASTDHGGGPPPGRGDTARDVTVLQIDLRVPAGHNCLRFDFAFFSEEFPMFIGSQFNDGFIAELGESTWTTSGSQIMAPNNFAHPLDAPGEVVSVNTIGVGWSADEASDLAYGGGTVPLTASTPIEPGPQRLYLSIFDQGDGIYDSAVFIEDLRTTTVLDEGQCRSGAAPSIERPLVLLPGIMGSYLGSDAGTGSRVWPSSRVARTALLPDGRTTVAGRNVDVMRDRGANGMIKRAYGARDVYGTMVSYYEDRGYVVGQTLFPYGTDWRLAPQINAQRMWAWLEQEGVFDEYDSVDIIAHSQGGLVAHDAIAQPQVAGVPGSQRVEHLVTIGTPWLGSADMSTILLYGEPCKVQFGFCLYNRATASEAIRHMPGALQLLPTDHYPRYDGPWNAFHGRNRNVELAAYANRIGGEGTPLLYRAVQDATARFARRAFQDVDTLHLVGSGVATTAQIEEVRYDPCAWYQRGRDCDEPEDVVDSRFERGVAFARTLRRDGDGTVLVESAQMGFTGSASLPEARRAYVRRDLVGDDAEHDALVRSEAVLEYARQFISDTLPTPRRRHSASAALDRAGTLDAAEIDASQLSDERLAWLRSPQRILRAGTDETAVDPVPGISDEPAMLEGVAFDLTGVGTATISDGRGNEAVVDLRSPMDDPLELEDEDPRVLELLEAIDSLEGVTLSVMEGRMSLFAYRELPSTADETSLADDPAAASDAATPSISTSVQVTLEPAFEQEIGLEVSAYQNGGLERIRVLPQTMVESDELTIELDRDGDLPDSVRIGGEDVSLGPVLETDTLPPLPTSTVNRRLSVLGLPTVDVAAHVDGDDAVAHIEWRTDVAADWERVTGTHTTLGPFADDEVVWVRASTDAGFTQTPAHRLDLAAPPAVTDVCADVPAITFADGTEIAVVHLDNVNCMAAYEITVGVDDVPNFAPGRQVTRQQMATFIARLLRVATTGSTALPDDAANVEFVDVAPDNVHAPAISWLASIGVTDGITPDLFAPQQPVTRQQMASFIARAQRHLGAFEEADIGPIIATDPDPALLDLNTAAPVHRPNIEVLRALEVVDGFADGTYGPGLPVTRQQMAAFVIRSAALLASLDRWDARLGEPDGALGDDQEDPNGVDDSEEDRDHLQADPVPGVDAAVSTYRTGQWSQLQVEDGWQRVEYLGEGDYAALLSVRRLPGWWAAEALVDAFRIGEAWFQGFDGVEIDELDDDPRFPDAERAVQVRATIIATIGGPEPETGPWAWGDHRRYLIDHGDHAVEVAWEVRVVPARWTPFIDGEVVDATGVDVADSLQVRAMDTALLPEPADPSAVDWTNATITYREGIGDEPGVQITLTDGEFDGISPDGSSLRVTLHSVVFGDATPRGDLEALLILDSSERDWPFGLVITAEDPDPPGDRDWRQFDIPTLFTDTQRLIAVRNIVFEVADDGGVHQGLFQAGDVFAPVQ